MTGQAREVDVGAEVSGYRLTHLLGEGGMATVFRGENLLNPTIVRAIKIVHPELGGRREFVKRFAAEASILERLSHPNVVKFYGVRQDQGRLVMELELLEGSTLTTRLGPGLPPVALKDAVGWALQAAQGLEAAHALGVLHRDIKPDNLFVVRDANATLKVLDFGIARALDESASDTRQTKAGTTPGTAAYLAPEVWKAAEPTAAVDVYALGLTLLELALGRHPFLRPGQRPLSSAQLMYLHLQEPLPLLRAERPDAPEVLEQVISRATAREPSARYATARELGEALRGVLGVLTGAPAVEPVPMAPEVRTSFELPTLDPRAPALRAAPIGVPIAAAVAVVPSEHRTAFELAHFEAHAPATATSEPRPSAATESEAAAGELRASPLRSRTALLAAGGAILTLVVAVGAWPSRAGPAGVAEATDASSGGAKVALVEDLDDGQARVGVSQDAATTSPAASTSASATDAAVYVDASTRQSAAASPPKQTAALSAEDRAIAVCRGKVPLFNSKQEQTLKGLEMSGRPELEEKATSIREQVKAESRVTCDRLRAEGKL